MNALADEHGFARPPQGTKIKTAAPFFVGTPSCQEAGVTVDELLGFLRSLTRHLQQTYTLSTDHVFSRHVQRRRYGYLLAYHAGYLQSHCAGVGMMLKVSVKRVRPHGPSRS